MKITIITMFPAMLDSLFQSPIVQHAIEKGIVEIEVTDLKAYADGSYRHIDDSPYGGGAGMVIRYDVMKKALNDRKNADSYVVMTSAAGVPYTQEKAHMLCEKKHLVILCGHYEGVDARIDLYCDEKISIGDYIVSGGEYAGMIIADSLVRLMDGVIKKESTDEESFENGLLEYPQYTRPYEYDGDRVPEILLSGNHEKIREWRERESYRITEEVRPDLIERRKRNSDEEVS